MSANQGETIEVLTSSLQGNTPTFHGVALFAISTELRFMNVGMTVGALGADIREHGAGVALHACDFGVHTHERILRLVVIEFRDIADRLPTGGRMAVVAGDVQ